MSIKHLTSTLEDNFKQLQKKVMMMNNRMNHLLVACLLFLSVRSVSGQFIYVNDSGAANMSVSDQGDLKLLALFGITDKSIQLGYSPFKGLAIKGEYFNSVVNFNSLNEDKSVNARGNFYTASVGTYYLIMKARERELRRTYRNVSEKSSLLYLNGGYTRGKLINEFKTNERKTSEGKLYHNKYFVDAGIRMSYYIVSFNFNLKYSRIFYQKGIFNGDLNNYIESTIERLEEDSIYSTLELDMMMEVGIRQIRLFVGFPQILKTDLSRINNRVFYIGLMLEFDEMTNRLGK